MHRSTRARAASLAVTALIATVLPHAVAAAAPEVAPRPQISHPWLGSGTDPAGLAGAFSAYGAKIPATFEKRLRYVHDGLLRVMVSVTERNGAIETFIDDSTTWVKWYFDNPRFYAAVTPDQLETLLRSRLVLFVEPDVPLTHSMASSTIDIRARSLAADGTGVWSYDPAGGARGALRSDVAGLSADQATGAGVTVAITDSGIDRTHRDFGGWDCAPGPLMPCESRILRTVSTEHLIGTELSDALPTTEAASGHGTHVAGTVAGNGYYARDGGDDAAAYGADGIPFGVAPQANLISTKNGDSQWAGLSQFGLEWQLEHAAEYGIRVSSNSWGCLGGCSFNGNSATGLLFKDLYNAGVLTVFAAGNDGGNQSGTAFSGNAQSPYVLGVASYDDATGRLASSSSRGSDNTLPDAATWTPESEPVNGERRSDVGAPGVGIWSARTLTGGTSSLVPRGNTTDATGGGGCCIREYATMSGTSMATPHVAGTAALVYSACPTATPLDAMRAIMATAERDVLKSSGAQAAEPFEVGYGGLNARGAVTWLLSRGCDSGNAGGDPTPDPTPTPTPTPTETEPTGGGTTYYFHSLSGDNTLDQAFDDGATFDTAFPTWAPDQWSKAQDLPGFQNAGAIEVVDPTWRGSLAERARSITLDIWGEQIPDQDLGEIHYTVRVLPQGATAYTELLPPIERPVTEVGIINIKHTFTSMRASATAPEEPLDLPAGPLTFTVRGTFTDSDLYTELRFDSTDMPAGFTTDAGGGPEPSPSPSSSEEPPPPPPPSACTTYPAIPNDPFYTDVSILDETSGGQWGLRKIRASQAWQEPQSTGCGIRVAVLDTGLDVGNGSDVHPDFNCGGKFEFVPGSDLIENDNVPNDENGHGTHTAGIVGACTNNGTGVAGVAPDSTIMPIRVLDETGSGTDVVLADGIRLATDSGAHVINMSLGFISALAPTESLGDFFPELEAAIDYARANGVVVIAAAGNETFPLCAHPAIYEDVICVGSSDTRDMNAWYGNFPVKTDENEDFGPGVLAPGGSGAFGFFFCQQTDEEVMSTYLRAGDECGDAGYEAISGTSMAAPHVAGVAALVYDRLNGERTAANGRTVIDAIINSALDLYAPGYDPASGYGRVDALGAVQQVPVQASQATTLTFEGSQTSAQHSDSASLPTLLVAEDSAPVADAPVTISLLDQDGATIASAEGVTDAAGIAAASLSLAGVSPGTYTVVAAFAGAEGFEPSTAESLFDVVKEDSATSLSVTGLGAARSITATVTDADAPTALAGRVVHLYADGNYVTSAVTNQDGVATFDLSGKNSRYRGLGYTFEAVFPGDDLFIESSDTQAV